MPRQTFASLKARRLAHLNVHRGMWQELMEDVRACMTNPLRQVIQTDGTGDMEFRSFSWRLEGHVTSRFTLSCLWVGADEAKKQLPLLLEQDGSKRVRKWSVCLSKDSGLQSNRIFLKDQSL